jgi:hypothetical protein
VLESLCAQSVSSNAAFIKDPNSAKVFAVGGRDDWEGGDHPMQGGLQTYGVLLLQADSLADALTGALQRPDGDVEGGYPVMVTGDHEGCFEARSSGSGGRCMFDNKVTRAPSLSAQPAQPLLRYKWVPRIGVLLCVFVPVRRGDRG